MLKKDQLGAQRENIRSYTLYCHSLRRSLLLDTVTPALPRLCKIDIAALMDILTANRLLGHGSSLLPHCFIKASRRDGGVAQPLSTAPRKTRWTDDASSWPLSGNWY
jgi:hypothetical protein